MVKRKGGRPPGRTAFMVERVRRLVGNLADATYCIAGDAWLARRLDCSTRSIQRYLKILSQTDGLVRTAVHVKNRGSWKTKRVMKFQREPAFGVPRDNVLSMQKRQPTQRPKPTAAISVDYTDRSQEVEGFGRPYHEDLPQPVGQRPIAVFLPPALLQEKLRYAEQVAKNQIVRDPEHLRLWTAWIRYHNRRARSKTT